MVVVTEAPIFGFLSLRASLAPSRMLSLAVLRERAGHIHSQIPIFVRLRHHLIPIVQWRTKSKFLSRLWLWDESGAVLRSLHICHGTTSTTEAEAFFKSMALSREGWMQHQHCNLASSFAFFCKTLVSPSAAR